MRLDIYLSERNFAESRTRAKNLIELHYVAVNGRIIDKVAYDVKDGDTVEILQSYGASLGGIKLQKALNHAKIVVKDKLCLDIGSSNGGFCDVLLHNGAQKVIALDVGECALPERLKKDGRIIIKDRTNARFITKEDLPFCPEIITVDVSFISLTQILPAVSLCIKDNGIAVCLIKPQFECGKSSLSKKGIIIDKKQEKYAIDKVQKCANELHFTITDFCPAPHPFEKKNQEYLICLRKTM